MKIITQCFHEDEFKAYPMKELDLENGSISFKCIECGKETLVKVVLE